MPVAGAGGADVQTPKRGGTIVIGLPSPEPACLNMLDARCHPGTSLITIASAVLGGAFELGPDLSARPGLADVRYTKRPPFTLTHRIRPEARWSDGVPVTARDFLFTLGAIRRSSLTVERQVHSPVRRPGPEPGRSADRSRRADGSAVPVRLHRRALVAGARIRPQHRRPVLERGGLVDRRLA
jgi:hypothetical protein